MGAGGSTTAQGGSGNQTTGRPMTPFSLQDGSQMGGMQGFNTSMGAPSQMGNLGQMASMIQMSKGQQAPGYGGGLGSFIQSGAMGGGFDLSQLSRMSSLIQGGGDPFRPQGQIPQSMMPFQQSQGMAPQYQTQFPQSMTPFQQSQGMTSQPPATQSPMQQGLGGLAAYMGGGK